MRTRAAPARYFPVRESAYRMAAGLQPFETDFGNGDADAQFFQRDTEANRYRRAKSRARRARSGVLSRGGTEREAHRAVLQWVWAQWAREHPDELLPTMTGDPEHDYAAIAAEAQEDLTVLHRDSTGHDAAIAVYVAFPSGWRPERILGATFAEIHRPVPSFSDDDAQARALTTSMIDRGPYVRFVWTLAADDELDHHPEEGTGTAWGDSERGWLRVERQVTVPFPTVGTSLFLIRTYLYPFEALLAEQRAILHRALASMPPEIARYKGLDGENGAIAQRLLLE